MNRPVSELSDPGRVLLWDLDGTIADTGRDIATAVGDLLIGRGLKPLPLESVLRHVGRGVRVLVVRSLNEAGAPAADEAELELAIATFRAHYGRHLMDTTRAFPGIPELLDALRGKGRRMGVVTNKPEDFSRKILQELGLLPCFAAVVGGDTLPERKPAPAPLLHALEICAPGTPPGRCVLIGDSITDVKTARAAGAPVCAVGWGIDPDGELRPSEPDWWMQTPDELRAALLGA